MSTTQGQSAVNQHVPSPLNMGERGKDSKVFEGVSSQLIKVCPFDMNNNANIFTSVFTKPLNSSENLIIKPTQYGYSP